MKKFKNIHYNKRAFIVANGPSLNKLDLSKLNNDVIFSLNRGYLKKELPHITYIVVCNDLVEKQFGNEILKIPCKAIFSNNLPNTYKLHWTPDIPTFQPDATKAMWQGHTVTYVAMQLAYYMGYNPVYVVGLDHFYDYSTSKQEKGRGITSQGPDPNHFDPNYFGDGVRWDRANLKKSEEAYSLAREFYNINKRLLFNASAETHLSRDVLPKINFTELFLE